MKRNGKKSKKIRKLIITCTLSAIVLIVSTYTWFIGMQTVNVNPFEISVATTEGLFLSMDGKSWVYNLDINDDTPVYTGNTNTWAEEGLKPISTVGDVDPEVSRLKLFEKASLTTSPGGYRLLASRVKNYKDEKGNLQQGEGYVAFDLFIKNLSGHAYYTSNEVLNEEAIYLTTDSSVIVKNTGADDTQLQTGIENSIRVGFVQIGRVESTTESVDTITGISCSYEDTDSSTKYSESTKVTSTCRNAQIWEPNEAKHVSNAKNWYLNSCITRKAGDAGKDVTKPASYNVATYDADGSLKTAATYCADFTGKVPTYAITRELKIEDNVDVYDGLKFNTYTGNSIEQKDYPTYDAASDKSGYKLVEFPYFTDEMKNKKSTNRPTFMTLAPNSITKVRVYIWLEGQDIDNYDFASLGAKISVNFGFTKERFTEDINGDNTNEYDGPALVTPDNADISSADHAQ